MHMVQPSIILLQGRHWVNCAYIVDMIGGWVADMQVFSQRLRDNCVHMHRPRKALEGSGSDIVWAYTTSRGDSFQIPKGLITHAKKVRMTAGFENQVLSDRIAGVSKMVDLQMGGNI